MADIAIELDTSAEAAPKGRQIQISELRELEGFEICNWVRYSNNDPEFPIIRPSEKSALDALAMGASHRGCSVMTDELLAKIMRVGRKTATRAIKDLVEKGLVYKQPKGTSLKSTGRPCSTYVLALAIPDELAAELLADFGVKVWRRSARKLPEPDSLPRQDGVKRDVTRYTTEGFAQPECAKQGDLSRHGDAKAVTCDKGFASSEGGFRVMVTPIPSLIPEKDLTPLAEPGSAVPASSGRKEIFEAITKACYSHGSRHLTPSARSMANKAAKEIDQVGGTSDSVRAAAERYRETYPRMTLTPSALAKHWPALVGERVNGTARKDGSAFVAFWAQVREAAGHDASKRREDFAAMPEVVREMVRTLGAKDILANNPTTRAQAERYHAAAT